MGTRQKSDPKKPYNKCILPQCFCLLQGAHGWICINHSPNGKPVLPGLYDFRKDIVGAVVASVRNHSSGCQSVQQVGSTHMRAWGGCRCGARRQRLRTRPSTEPKRLLGSAGGHHCKGRASELQSFRASVCRIS